MFVEQWLAAKEPQTALNRFASSYKKLPSFLLQKKSGLPIATDQGNQQTEAMFKTVLAGKSVDISSVSATWNHTNWHYGYSPEYASGPMLTPNSAALLKVQAIGKLEVIAIEVRSLKTAMAAFGENPTKLDELTNFLDALTPEKADEAKLKGLKMFRALTEMGTLLYVPVGYLLAERSYNSAVCVGVRKSFFITGETTAALYNEPMELLEKKTAPTLTR